LLAVCASDQGSGKNAFEKGNIMRQTGIKPGQRRQNHSKPASAAANRSVWRLGVLGATLLLAGCGGWVFAEFVLWNKLPSELVGKWVVEGGEQDGATFDFYRGGTMVGRVNLNGREGTINAQIEIQDDRLLATTKNPNTGAMETRTQRIVQLTRTRLVLRDERGNVLYMTRADD
jgi:uncharacterized protein (TIGR03066 family)